MLEVRSGCCQQEAGQTGPCKLNKRKQHWPEEETQRTGPPHSAMAIMVIPAAPRTPIRPRGANRAAVAAWPAARVAVVANRANPPGREERGDPIINFHTASPDTTGKLTENKINN